MQPTSGNIQMRPRVYKCDQGTGEDLGIKRFSNEDIEKHVHKFKKLGEEHYFNIHVQKWPPEIKNTFYTLWKNDESNESSSLKLRQVLLKLSKITHISTKSLNIINDNIEGHKGAPPHTISESAKPSISMPLMSVVIFISVFITYFYLGGNGTGQVACVPNKIEEWENNILDLRAKFPSQDEGLWYSIQAGVKATVTDKPVQPSIFLLLYNDKRTSECLAQSLGKEAAKLLSESPQEPIIVRGEELKMNKSLLQDYGSFTETYKHEINERHVMVILDLQEIPAILAQAFHILCDVENPLVHNSAFLFTMLIDETGRYRPTPTAEKHLKLLWENSLHVDIMDPLITRITNMVLAVNLETRLQC